MCLIYVGGFFLACISVNVEMFIVMFEYMTSIIVYYIVQKKLVWFVEELCGYIDIQYSPF